MPEQNQVQEQEEKPVVRRHVWYYRPDKTSKAQVYEFGMPLTGREAEDRIANLLGEKEFPKGGLLTVNPPHEPHEPPKEKS
jgi:hypothetical protein